MNLLDLFVKIDVDDQASSKVGGIAGSITSGLGKAAATVGKVVAGATAAAGAGAIAVGKAALDGYKEFEQLEGGVAKLYGNAGMTLEQYAQSVGKTTDEAAAEYERNEKAQESMLQHAQEAYKTAGMSANEYMQNATQFSASLIKSLGGDTERAAELTDVAMRAISDNVNTFGSDAEAATNAVIGLSRQNYTMLDNLKLGYAGSAQGMLELINDSGVLGETLTDTSQLAEVGFDKMIEAIQRVQEQQGIAGTTAREAMGTIEGSATAAKASWDNLMTAIGSGDSEMIVSSVNGLMDSIFGEINNQTGEREGGLIENLLPVMQNVGNALAEQIPGIAESMASTFIQRFGGALGIDTGTVDEFFATLNEKFQQGMEVISSFWESFTGNVDLSGFESAADTAKGVLESIWTFVEENILANSDQIGEFLATAVTAVGDIAGAAGELYGIVEPYLPFLLTAVATFSVLMPIMSAVAGVIGTISTAVTLLTTVIVPALAMVQSVGGAVSLVVSLLGGPITILAAIAAAVVAFVATNEDARNKIIEIVQAVIDFFATLPERAAKLWEDVKAGVETFVNDVLVRWNEFKQNASELWENLKTMVVSKALELAHNTIEKFVELKEGAEQKFDELVTWVTGVPQRIKDALGDLGELLKSAGESIINGLFEGMTKVWEDAKDWVSGIGDWIAENKGPIDYDLRLLVPNGRAIMDGLRKGLGRGFETEVMPYVDSMADQMSKAMETSSLIAPDIAMPGESVPTRTAGGVSYVSDKDVLNVLTAILAAIPTEVTLDKDALVGELAPEMNVALGRL